MLKKLTALLLAALLVVLTGCSNSLKTENAELKKQITELNMKNTELSKKNDQLNKENETLNNKISEAEVKSSNTDQDAVKAIEGALPIYTADTDSLDKKIYFWVYVNDESTVKGKLNILLKALSKSCFGGLPIEITQIKQVNGKKIATINLKESRENQIINNTSKYKGSSWAAEFFQGSTGGSITATSLSETVLQRDYKGEWIDGVEFKYNNKPIDFEHVPDLADTIYR